MAKQHSSPFRCGALAAFLLLTTIAPAAPLVGTVLTNPGDTVFPGLTSESPGALLASLIAPFSFTTTAGTTSGTLTSAVYRNGSGTLDFYYQVANDVGSATAIARETDTSFAGFTTWLGFRTDAPGPFAAGSLSPTTGDRNIGSVIGFNFAPPDSAKIGPGLISDILVISTDAANFRAGNASVIDGGAATVDAFQPLGTRSGGETPEAATNILVGGGLVGLIWLSGRRRA